MGFYGDPRYRDFTLHPLFEHKTLEHEAWVLGIELDPSEGQEALRERVEAVKAGDERALRVFTWERQKALTHEAQKLTAMNGTSVDSARAAIASVMQTWWDRSATFAGQPMPSGRVNDAAHVLTWTDWKGRKQPTSKELVQKVVAALRGGYSRRSDHIAAAVLRSVRDRSRKHRTKFSTYERRDGRTGEKSGDVRVFARSRAAATGSHDEELRRRQPPGVFSGSMPVRGTSIGGTPIPSTSAPTYHVKLSAEIRAENRRIGEEIAKAPPEWAYPLAWRLAVMAVVESNNNRKDVTPFDTRYWEQHVAPSLRAYHQARLDGLLPDPAMMKAVQEGAAVPLDRSFVVEVYDGIACQAYERGRPGSGGVR